MDSPDPFSLYHFPSPSSISSAEPSRSPCHNDQPLSLESPPNHPLHYTSQVPSAPLLKLVDAHQRLEFATDMHNRTSRTSSKTLLTEPERQLYDKWVERYESAEQDVLDCVDEFVRALDLCFESGSEDSFIDEEQGSL